MRKRLTALVTALCLTLSMLTTAGAASYYPRYTGSGGSIAAALDSLGVDSSFAHRADIAAANGVANYSGTAAQNTGLLSLLKQGALLRPEDACYPRYTGSTGSLAAALDSLGEDSSFAHRAEIAAANGVADYSGTAAQNTGLLNLLKQGALLRPGAEPAAQDSSGTLLSANLDRVPFIRQDDSTCKATSAAMAVNVIVGFARYSTASMIYSGALCKNLNGYLYTGSDGGVYRTTYQTDGYVGSRNELLNAVETALAAGLPTVAAVHSTRSGGTRHHWIVVVGKSADGSYLAVDPVRSGSGSMASQARTMSLLGYDFGLTDYSTPHYGYISFQRR